MQPTTISGLFVYWELWTLQIITEDLMNSSTEAEFQTIIGNLQAVCDDAQIVYDNMRSQIALGKLGKMCADLVDDDGNTKSDDFDDVITEMSASCSDVGDFLGTDTVSELLKVN